MRANKKIQLFLFLLVLAFISTGCETLQETFSTDPKQVQMPEPDEEKMVKFIIELKKNNILIKYKELRNLTLPL